MIASTALHAFSMPTRPAATGNAATAAMTARNGTDASAHEQTGANGTTAAPATGARGALLDRWA